MGSKEEFLTPTGLRANVARVGDDEFLVLSYPVTEPQLPASLTVAERDVARRILSGATICIIAGARGTSPRTIANQLHAIYRKARVSSRVELAAKLRERP